MVVEFISLSYCMLKYYSGVRDSMVHVNREGTVYDYEDDHTKVGQNHAHNATSAQNMDH